MRGVLLLGGLLLIATAAAAQPADCPQLPPAGDSLHVSVPLAGRPGASGGGSTAGGSGRTSRASGSAYVEVPLQAPRSDCGEPALPADILGGPPGDLLRGTRDPSGQR